MPLRYRIHPQMAGGDLTNPDLILRRVRCGAEGVSAPQRHFHIEYQILGRQRVVAAFRVSPQPSHYSGGCTASAAADSACPHETVGSQPVTGRIPRFATCGNARH